MVCEDPDCGCEEEEEECDCDECCSRRGFQGPVGFQGLSQVGPRGLMGPQGTPSHESGPQGVQGFQAELNIGQQGPDGMQGPPSGNERGMQGLQGFQGSEEKGLQGAPGFQGQQGDFTTGPQGYQGPPPTILNGNQGPQGFQGPPNVGVQGGIGPPQEVALLYNRSFEIDVTNLTATTTRQKMLTNGRCTLFNLPNSLQFVTVGFELTLFSNADDLQVVFTHGSIPVDILETRRTFTFNEGQQQSIMFQFFFTTPTVVGGAETVFNYWTNTSSVNFRVRLFSSTCMAIE